MNKNKVIIITRHTEYVEFENNEMKPKQGRELFGTSIIKELMGDTHYSNDKYAVIKTLKAMKEVSAFRDNLLEKAIDNGVDIGDDNELTAEKELTIKKELIKKYTDSQEVGKEKCYVSFIHDDLEIVLLLWDKLAGQSDDKVEPFDLFVDALCDDCGVTDTNNYLYIHDKQLYGIEHKDEDILSDGNCKEGYEYFKNHFKYVAAFRHAPSGYFVDRILKFRFGEKTMAEQISELETKATTFAQLRQQADAILNNDANKSKKL